MHGFVTNHANMLLLSREMVVLARSQLTLVIAGAVGHLPMVATELVMVYLTQVAAQVSRRPQIFRLAVGAVSRFRSTPHEVLRSIAQRQGAAVEDLIRSELAEIGPGL